MEAYYLLNSKRRNVPYTWLFISKQVLTVGLILLSIVDLGEAIHASTSSSRTVHSVDYCTPIIKIVSFVSTFFYITVDFKYIFKIISFTHFFIITILFHIFSLFFSL